MGWELALRSRLTVVGSWVKAEVGGSEKLKRWNAEKLNQDWPRITRMTRMGWELRSALG